MLGGAGLGAVIVLGIAAKMGVFGKGGLDRGRLGAVRALPSPLWLVAAATTFLMQGVGLGLAQYAGLSGDGFEGEAATKTFASLVGVVAAVGLALIVNRSAPGAGLKAAWRDVGIGALGFAMLVPILGFVAVAAAEIGVLLTGPPDGAAHATLRLITERRDEPWAWALIAVAVVGAPIVEELVYRGFLQSSLLAATRKPWLSIVVTAGIFALTHWAALPEDGRHALAPLFVLGLGLGVVVERTKRVWAAVVLHALFNAANIAVAMAVG